jgi:hypothetical protein
MRTLNLFGKTSCSQRFSKAPATFTLSGMTWMSPLYSTNKTLPSLQITCTTSLMGPKWDTVTFTICMGLYKWRLLTKVWFKETVLCDHLFSRELFISALKSTELTGLGITGRVSENYPIQSVWWWVPEFLDSHSVVQMCPASMVTIPSTLSLQAINSEYSCHSSELILIRITQIESLGCKLPEFRELFKKLWTYVIPCSITYTPLFTSALKMERLSYGQCGRSIPRMSIPSP